MSLFHSAIGLVTNSSTSISTKATGSTVECVKSIVKEMLNLLFGEGKEIVNEMFEIHLMDESGNAENWRMNKLNEENPKLESVWEEYNRIIEERDFPKWWFDTPDDWRADYESFSDVSLVIIPKQETYKPLAKALERFISTYDIDAKYNG